MRNYSAAMRGPTIEISNIPTHSSINTINEISNILLLSLINSNFNSDQRLNLLAVFSILILFHRNSRDFVICSELSISRSYARRYEKEDYSVFIVRSVFVVPSKEPTSPRYQLLDAQIKNVSKITTKCTLSLFPPAPSSENPRKLIYFIYLFHLSVAFHLPLLSL